MIPDIVRKAAGSQISKDPYFANVSLLLHMDSNFSDSSSNNLTMTPTNATISTLQSKFGGGSGLFNGSNTYVKTLTANPLNFGTGDFTVEFWFYMINTTNTEQTVIAGGSSGWQSGAVTIKAWNWYYANSISIQAYDFNTGGSPIVRSTSAASLSTWTHAAITRSGNTFRVFFNGNLQGTNTFTGSINLNHNNSTFLGYSNLNGANGYLNGEIDDLRVTKGVARYTSSFTPPTSAFPNS